MECTEFRQLIGADPAGSDPRAEEHARSCSACQAYAQRLRASEELIGTALRFDVQELKSNAELQRRRPAHQRLWAIAGTAAAVVAVVAIWALVRPSGEDGALVADVAEHWFHEPYSWVVTDVSVPEAKLRDVVANKARLDLARLGSITYATSCFFRGRWVPHLVVQGQAGPIMVLLLPDEPLGEAERVSIPEQGLAGVIVPHGSGSVAILGTAAEPMEPVQKSLLEAVEWSI